MTGLTLLLGPANSGKLGRVLEWWRTRLPQQAVVVTPTGPDARVLTAEMVGPARGLVRQSPAVTFDGLVQLLLGRVPRYAGELESDLVVSKVLGETPTGALRAAARLPGVVPAVRTLLQQLDESGRGPEEVDRILARWAASDASATTLVDDIRLLAGAYRQMCGQLGLADRPAAVRETIGALRGGQAAWSRPVALYGFTSFTPGQRSLIEELAQRVEVLVSFTYDDTREVNLCTAGEIDWWRARGRVEPASPPDKPYSSAAIVHLERYFMSDVERPEPPPAFEAGQGVRFLRASGRRAEAELAAEQIAELMRSGVEPGDIAVVVRSVPSWHRLMATVFSSCSIPCYLDHRPLLVQTGLGHAFLNVIRGVFLDDAGAVLAYLRSPYSGLSLDDVCDLELRYRRATAKGARALGTIAGEMGLQSVASLWAVSTTAHLLDTAAARCLGRAMLVASARGASPGSVDLEEDVRGYRALEGALVTFARVAPAGEASDATIDYRTVLGSLRSAAVAPQREDPAAVQVLSVQRARARRFRVVFVLGLVEGEFPGRADRPSLLSPAQRARLDQAGGGLFADEADDEAALFVSALSRAEQLLFLSTRDAEDDGSEATPSHFWSSAKQLLGVAEAESLSRTLGDQVFSTMTAPTMRQYERACVATGLGLEHAGIQGHRSVPSWERAPEALYDPAVLADLAARSCFSPSELESYVRCPFTWFVQRIVDAKELEVELDGRKVGNLLHSALRSTYERLKLSGLLPLSADRVQEAQRIAGVEIDAVVNGADCPGTTAERRLAAWQLRRMAANLFDMEVAAGWPLTFRELETWVCRRGGTDVGGFKITGRVDRIDETCDRRGLFIIDYKSGSIPSGAAIGGEDGLQLPLYLLATAAERPSKAVLGGAYLGLSDKKRSGIAAEGADVVVGEAGLQGCRLLDPTALEELLERTRAISRQAIEGMRSGVIAPRGDKSCPPWCELAPACRARKGGFRP